MGADPEADARSGASGERYTNRVRVDTSDALESYIARDTVLGRDVELDVARAAGEGPGSDWILRETCALARLEDPRTPAILDVGTLEDGRRFLARSPARGVSLEGLLADAQASGNGGKILRALIGAAEVIAYAHARGVGHGDLGPDAVLVNDFGGVQVVGWRNATVSGPERRVEDDSNCRADLVSLRALLMQASGSIAFSGKAAETFARVLARFSSPDDPITNAAELVAALRPLLGAAGTSRRRLRLRFSNRAVMRAAAAVGVLAVSVTAATAAYIAYKKSHAPRGSTIVANQDLLGLDAALSASLPPNAAVAELEYWALLTEAARAMDEVNYDDARAYLATSDPARRGWEWGYLGALASQDARTFDLRPDRISSVAYSPDGQTIVVASRDRRIKLLDARTGELVRSFDRHSDSVNSASFSPDGSMLVSAGQDGIAFVWDVASAEVMSKFVGHTEQVYTARFSPDGSRILSTGDDDSVRVWDASTGMPVQEFHVRRGPIWTAAWAPDGSRVVAGNFYGSVRVWGLESDRPLLRLEFPNEHMTGVKFSHRGDRFLVTTLEGSIHMYNALDGAELFSIADFGDDVLTSAFDRSDETFLTGGRQGVISAWDASTGARKATLLGHGDEVTEIVFDPRGEFFLSGSLDGTIKSWSTERWLRSGAETRTDAPELVLVDARDEKFRTLALSQDGSLAAGAWDGTAHAWDTLTGELLRDFAGHEGNVTTVAFSPDNRLFATGGEDNFAVVWDLASGAEIHRYAKRSQAPRDLVFERGGQQLAVASMDRGITVFDIKTNAYLYELKAHSDMVWSLAVHPSMRSLASGSWDETIRLWHEGPPSSQQVLRGHFLWIEALAFSPGGRYLASGGADHELIVWDLQTEQPILTFTHPNAVTGVLFSPDGLRLFSTCRDGAARVFDLAAGRRILTLDDHDGELEALAYDESSRTLTVMASDGAILRYEAAAWK